MPTVHTTRRTVLTVAVALGAALVTVGSAIAMPAPDPIFAAIEAHQVAWDNLLTASAERGAMPDDADDAPLHAAVRVWSVAEKTLIATVPTTRAGLRALESYLRLAHNEPMVGRTPWTFYTDAGGELVADRPSVEAIIARHAVRMEV